MRNLIFALIVAVALAGCARYSFKKEVRRDEYGTYEVEVLDGLTPWGKFVSGMDEINQEPATQWMLLIGNAYMYGVNLPASGSAPAWDWPVPPK